METTVCVHNARNALAPLIKLQNSLIPQEYISGTPETSSLQSKQSCFGPFGELITKVVIIPWK